MQSMAVNVNPPSYETSAAPTKRYVYTRCCFYFFVRLFLFLSFSLFVDRDDILLRFLPYLQNAPPHLPFSFRPPSPFLLDIGFDRPTRWFVRPHFFFFILNDEEMYDECSSAPRERKKERKGKKRILRTMEGTRKNTNNKRKKKSRKKREYVGLSHHFPFNLHSYHVPIIFFRVRAHISEINRRSTVSAAD